MATRRLDWTLIILAYWAAMVENLRWVSPVLWDGSGPMPSFDWGRLPTPEPREYYRHQAYYEFVYFLAYAAGATSVTAVGCGSAALTLRCRSARPFVRSFGSTLVLLILLALVSDLGGRLSWWRGPQFFLQWSHGLSEVLALCRSFLPASALAGLVAVFQNWLARAQPR